MDQSDSKRYKGSKRRSERIKSNSKKSYKEYNSDDEESKLAIFDDSGSDFEDDLKVIKRSGIADESSSEEERFIKRKKRKVLPIFFGLTIICDI